MVHRITSYFAKRYLPRWIVLVFDLTTVLITFLTAYILRFNFDLNQVANHIEFKQIFVVLPIFLISFWLVKPYAGILRHSTTRDITLIIFALSISSILLLLISYFSRKYYPNEIHIIPYSVIIIQFALSALVTVTMRLLVKGIFDEQFKSKKEVKNVMIFGAGRLGQITRNALKSDNSNQIKIIGFIDDNISLQNKSVAGVPIYNSKVAFDKIIEQQNVNEIIIAITKPQLTLTRKREIVELCLPKKLLIKEVPSVTNWIHEELNVGEIKKIRIEDLLGRDKITLDIESIKKGVNKATILISGAAGSIGSEIVRQLMMFNAHHVILLDKAESDLYDLQNEIQTRFKDIDFTAIVGDVCNEIKLRKIFKIYAPSIVINAAAYKHVPLMEEYPCEAIRVNIGGTRNLANLSVEFGVEKFVLVSTDKAVNPTNVMGASKRISEIFIQSLARHNSGITQFITTRFGNVLGSNGSVVPLFKKQIENGGPVMVTHEDITRYFMTIPEACQLVLEACFMGKGGEIFVFDMGEPVKIYNLAEKMIYLSGFIPHEDIKIEVCGLRPGEKLYEELLSSKENTLPTHNDKIMIGKTVKHEYLSVNGQVTDLLDNVDIYHGQKLVDLMRALAPEFVSQNSHFTNNTCYQEDLQAPV